MVFSFESSNRFNFADPKRYEACWFFCQRRPANFSPNPQRPRNMNPKLLRHGLSLLIALSCALQFSRAVRSVGIYGHGKKLLDEAGFPHGSRPSTPKQQELYAAIPRLPGGAGHLQWGRPFYAYKDEAGRHRLCWRFGQLSSVTRSWRWSGQVRAAAIPGRSLWNITWRWVGMELMDHTSAGCITTVRYR